MSYIDYLHKVQNKLSLKKTNYINIRNTRLLTIVEI